MTASDNDDTNSKRTDSGESGPTVGEVSNADESGANATVRDILSERPFPRAARLWRDKGWTGTIPLPAKAKNPPPTGWTGRNAGFADNEQISEWCRQAKYKKGNIGLHLGFAVVVTGRGKLDGEYEVIGIDVDDYEDNGKIKEGAKQLAALELQLGSLPRTYVSTARASRGDFNSGIRFFLVPRGLAFRGQVDKDIEVIQKSHRFAVVWPSYNPKSDSQYCLYHPDEFFGSVSSGGDGNSRGRKNSAPVTSASGIPDRIPTPLHEVPHVTELPILPDKWLDYLTNGMMLDADGGIDMDSSVPEIEEWAKDTFNDPDNMCQFMRKVVNRWKKEITDEATSHDKVRDAHWEIVNCGAEGHTGWNTALEEIDKHWIEDVMSRSKRSVQEMRGEIFRSKVNSVRKVKVKVQNVRSAGAQWPPAECKCVQMQAIVSGGGVVATMGGNAGGLFSDTDNDDAGPPDGLDGISWGVPGSPEDYEMNDDGNGEFLMDLLRARSGRIKFVMGYGWLFWTDGTINEPSRWIVDPIGEKGEPGPLIRRAFWRVKRVQALFAEQKQAEAQQALDNNGGQRNAQINAMFALAKKWQSWSLKSGNNVAANSAINAAKNQPGVMIPYSQLNSNWRLLGVANGVVELRNDGAYLRSAHQSDFVTVNTNVPWTQWSGIPIDDIGKRMWQEYLDRFIPVERRDYYQMVLGHTILGGNQERIMPVLLGGTSTGKSTMLHAMGAALGEYSGPANVNVFGNDKLQPALVKAMSMRAVFMSELSAGDKINAAAFKRITGDDQISAEMKYSNVTVEGTPQFVPIMATNAAPEIDGADAAVRKRLLVLSFDQRIEERRDEKGAGRALKEHAAEAILAWLIDGYNLYCQAGHKLTKDIEVERTTDEFTSELDHVSQFMSEMLSSGSDDDKVHSQSVFDAYEAWCDVNGLTKNARKTKFQLTPLLSAKGLTYRKSMKISGRVGTGFVGVRIRPRPRVTGGHINVVPPMMTESEEKKQKESD